MELSFEELTRQVAEYMNALLDAGTCEADVCGLAKRVFQTHTGHFEWEKEYNMSDREFECALSGVIAGRRLQ